MKWQAKFYHPSPRLDASRKRSITGSLTTAIANHPALKKWFLCTPTNFTNKGRDNELTWFETVLKRLAPNIELDHWGDSGFSDMLSHPEMVGKRNYFFGELDLTPEWFERQVARQLENVREKFLPELHTETIVDFRVHCLLGDETFLATLDQSRDGIVAELRIFMALFKN